jgi:hypothetical protein
MDMIFSVTISIKDVLINTNWWYEHGDVIFVVHSGIERFPNSNLPWFYIVPRTAHMKYYPTKINWHVSHLVFITHFRRAPVSVIRSQFTGIAHNRCWVIVRQYWRRYQLRRGRGRGCRVNCMSRPFDLCLEPCRFVSLVAYCTGGAICLEELVVAFDLVTYSFFCLLLDVVSVIVSDAVFKFILGRSLKYNNNNNNIN